MAESDLKENPFRDEIYDYFLAHGYIAGQKADYDYKHALDVGKLFSFLLRDPCKALYAVVYVYSPELEALAA